MLWAGVLALFLCSANRDSTSNLCKRFQDGASKPSSENVFYFSEDFIYLRERESEPARAGMHTGMGAGETKGKGEADLVLSTEHQAGLHPTTPEIMT